MQNQKNLIHATADFEHWRQTRINKHARWERTPGRQGFHRAIMEKPKI